MVWDGVSQHHRTELGVIAGNLNAVRYREDILLHHMVPFLQAHPDMTLHVCETCSVYVSVVESYVHLNIYTLSLRKIDSERTFILLLNLG